jgi:hypothetical protein
MLVPLQTLQAQERTGNWNVFARVGLVAWDKAAALQDPVLASGECDYPANGMTCSSVWNNVMGGIGLLYGLNENLSVGLTFDVARPVSNGAYFPAAAMQAAGEQELTFVNMRMTIVQYQVAAEWAPGFAKLSPYVSGSLGGYNVYRSASKIDQAGVTGSETFADIMFSIGVGLDWSLGETTGFRVEIADMIYTGWDRSLLDPVALGYKTELFPDLLPEPPSESSTLHNFRFSLGFDFVP